MKKLFITVLPFARFFLEENWSKVKEKKELDEVDETLSYDEIARNDARAFVLNHEETTNELAEDAKAEPSTLILKKIDQEEQLTLVRVDGVYDKVIMPVSSELKYKTDLLAKPKGERERIELERLRLSYEPKLNTINKREAQVHEINARSIELGKSGRLKEKHAKEIRQSKKGVPSKNALHNNKLYFGAQLVVGAAECLANYHLIRETGTVSNGQIPFFVGGVSVMMAYSAHSLAECIYDGKKKQLWLSGAMGALSLSIPLTLRFLYAGADYLTIIPVTLFGIGVSLGLYRKWRSYYESMDGALANFNDKRRANAKVAIIKEEAQKDRESLERDLIRKASINTSDETITKHISIAQQHLDELTKERDNTFKEIKEQTVLAKQKAEGYGE